MDPQKIVKFLAPKKKTPKKGPQKNLHLQRIEALRIRISSWTTTTYIFHIRIAKENPWLSEHRHIHNNDTHLEDSSPSSPRHRDPLGGRSNCADRSPLPRSRKRDNKGSGWKKPQCKTMWLRKERSKLSWRRTPSHRNQWKKEPRVGRQRNKACKELPLRRKQQKRSGGAAAAPGAAQREKRENGERGDQVTGRTGFTGSVAIISVFFFLNFNFNFNFLF